MIRFAAMATVFKRFMVMAVTLFLLGLLCLLVIHWLSRSIPNNYRSKLNDCVYGVSVSALKCDTSGDKPRLSWEIKTTRFQTQSAYQILVASSEEVLATDKGNPWDRGKAVSNKSAANGYAGKPLAAGERFYWKVLCWNNPDEAEIKRVNYWIPKEQLAEMGKTRSGAFSASVGFKL